MEDNLRHHSDANPESGSLKDENLYLQMKMKAQFGGQYESFGRIPSIIENTFLKNVMEFETQVKNSKMIRIGDLLKPLEFKRSEEISDQEMKSELERLFFQLREKGMLVEFGRERGDRQKYAFITEELFDREINDVAIKGMFRCFAYEEFHPDPRLDLEEGTAQFFKNWFGRNTNLYSWEIGDYFSLPSGIQYPKAIVIEKFQAHFKEYTEISQGKYTIDGVEFEFKDENFGFGFVEGYVDYQIVNPNGNRALFGGPYKIYFSFECGWWSIFHFHLPGFRWDIRTYAE
ncbi:MAG: hypothetical protein C5B52_03345 [Bacteroidetes bacterium]|nr:MAG: hypothetical protein C5B52_03345 [Bacteroidota bacterium]